MDATRFDDFVQSLASPVNRRATIARLLAGLVAPLLPAAADANHGDGKRRGHPRARGRDSDAASGEKGKAKAKGRGGHDRGQVHDHGADQSRASGGKHGKQKKKGANAAGQQPERPHPTSCCSGATCTPGQGRNLPRCCYSGQDLRQGGTSFQGANLANASFAGATLTDLDFRTANLGHACFVDATLTGANLKGANLGGAIFCRTTMPNGSRNDTGCAKGTPCCPTCAETRRCARGQLCCNGNCLTGDCCADGERDACAAGQVCCDHACVSGDCCADANCATETCQRASCQDHHCAYSPVTGGDGPGCATICCQDATGSPTCCADGTTTCDSNGHCCQPESKETTCATGSANPKCGQVPNNCGQQVDCGPCADRTCQSGTCSDAGHTCHYTSVFGTSGPNCTTVCCEDINEESVCCPSGATVCRAVDGLCGCAGDAACGTGKHCCGNGECQQCCSVDDCPPNAACQAGTCVGGCDVCPSGCAYTSLQAAIAGTPTGGTIRLCPGTYATSVVVPKNLTIIGAGDGDGGTILDGGTTSRVFDIASGVTVTITDLTITRGNGDVGGGILVRPDGASLTMERVQVTNCQSTGLAPSGAGVSVSGGSSALLISCGIAYNVSQGAGGRGGGFLNNSTLTLDATRVEANQAASGGGGINFGTLVLKNGSVVTNNTATAGPGNGGGILNWAGTVSVSADSSVTGNHPDDCVNAFGGTGCPA